MSGEHSALVRRDSETVERTAGARHLEGRGSQPAAQLDEWTHLSRQIRRCRKCPLHRSRTQAVVYRGSLQPRVVFVGEAPGAAEDRVGLPFVGRAGRRLDEALIEAGIPAESTGMLNVLKCRPPANRFDARAAKVCRPYLDRQLAWLDPKLVVTLGSWALRTLDPSAPALLQTAGSLRTCQGRQLLPLIHPAATFHSRRFLDRWQLDLRTLRTEFARIADQTL